MTDLKKILANLIQCASVTPLDQGCQEYMMRYLSNLGFVCTPCNNPPVSNFFARFGTKPPLLVFAGHTDVVDTGDLSQWHASPFQLIEQDSRLIGRGVADMKGSLAAMLHMAGRFVSQNPDFPGSLGFLITSGEEGDDYDKGTPFVMKVLQEQGIAIDYCIVGEPSSEVVVGDVIKIGRRGSLTGYVHLEGKQGHVAYPHLAHNPIHAISPVLYALTQHVFDRGNAYFPPTTFQISKIQAGTEATNIIPQDIRLNFNIRFSTEQTADQLKEIVLTCFEKHGLKPTINWRLSGEPFLTHQGTLLTKTTEAIEKVSQIKPQLSTSGGTSDGRFIAPFGVQVLELGLVNASIHQINEWTREEDLILLEKMYFQICHDIFYGSS